MSSRTLAAVCGLVVCGLALSGCWFTPPPPPPTSVPTAAPDVRVVETGSNTAATEPDELPFNNCTSSVPLTGKHAVTRDLTYTTSWEFGTQVGIGGDITVSPLLKLNIDATVSAKYGRSVGQTTTFSDEFDINVPPKSRMTYVFNWKEAQRLGFIQADTARIDYKYPSVLQFAGAQASQDACEPAPVALTAPVPAPTPVGTLALTAPVPLRVTPLVVSRTPIAAATPTPTSIGVSAESFVKNWVNVDPNTDGVTRMSITPSGAMLSLQTFGKCSPTDCNWGVVRVTYGGSGPLNVLYRFSFKTATLSLLPQGNQLMVTEADHYTDSSARPDRKLSYVLR